jgi:hypothetical protein
MNKGILFLGDSFTWGEALELYCDTPKWIAEREKDNNNWPILLEKQDEDGIRFREQNRFPALVAKHFNKTALVSNTNGGCLAGNIYVAHKFLFNPDLYIDTIILQFSSLQREPLHVNFTCSCEFCKSTEWVRLFENTDELLRKVIEKTNLNYKEKLVLHELEKLIGKNWFDKEDFIDVCIKAKKDWYVNVLLDFYNNNIINWESGGRRKIYFIDSWDEESGDALRHESLLGNYDRNMIPLIGKDNNLYSRWNEWNKTFPFLHIGMEFKKTENGHPTLEQHQYLAKSVIKFLEEKNYE